VGDVMSVLVKVVEILKLNGSTFNLSLLGTLSMAESCIYNYKREKPVRK
jgi:hypothetical protein